jgi:hypothetical protein
MRIHRMQFPSMCSRKVDFIPNRFAIRLTQPSSPNGRLSFVHKKAG